LTPSDRSVSQAGFSQTVETATELSAAELAQASGKMVEKATRPQETSEFFIIEVALSLMLNDLFGKIIYY
jgi:hypothetical protein